MKRSLLTLASLALILSAPLRSSAHCEIPCGIYTDEMRIAMIAEHAATIEKSMAQITALSKDAGANANQLARWVANKESHATEVQGIVTQYFMTQRIKPSADKYQEKLVLLHALLIDAMKCKQTTDAAHVDSLRKNLTAFSTLYFGKEAHSHAHGDHDHKH